ncbi:MAG: GNAT family N-acetyltransferase [Thermoguttaceae bacterium]
MNSNFQTRLMERGDWDEVAELIYISLNVWNEKNRGFKLVTGSWETMRVFPRVYESLDPNCCILVTETTSGRIVGSCFFHPRKTHYSLGILNTHPDFFGHGIGSRLLNYVTEKAKQEGKPVRLVSGATNVDSFSLYSKAGFVPTGFYQDMTLKVPETGIDSPAPIRCVLREATERDIPQMLALEKELSGIEREKDYRFFLENLDGIWHSSLLLGPKGDVEGFLISVNDPGSNMLGPGLARTEEQAAALIRYELNFHRGRSPLWLVSSQHRKLVDAMYQIGAKNCDLHVTQVLGEVRPQQGIAFPTFMPETG